MNAHRRFGTAIATLLVILAFVPLSGCASDSSPEGDPTIRGVITDLSASPDDANVGSIRVVWTQNDVVGPQAAYDAAQLAITSDTTLVRSTSAGGATEPIEFADLKIGDIVDAWFTDGPVAESYPVQAGAAYVLVKGSYEGELPAPPGLSPPAE